MGIEKDTTFKFIGKNFLDIFFNLTKIPKSVDSDKIEELTEDLISLKIAQFRHDFIGSDGRVIVMLELKTKKDSMHMLLCMTMKRMRTILTYYFV